MFQTGLYEVISPVTIRREPRIVEYKNLLGKWIVNSVGLLGIGTQKRVFSVDRQRESKLGTYLRSGRDGERALDLLTDFEPRFREDRGAGRASACGVIEF